MRSRRTHLLPCRARALVGILLITVAACGPDNSNRALTSASARVSSAMTQWHKQPKWTAPVFKEPIQGVRMGDSCSFPTYDEVAATRYGHSFQTPPAGAKR